MGLENFSIIHSIPTVGAMSFGLGPVALNLTREQIKLGKNASIWCLDSTDGQRWGSASSGLSENRIHIFKKSWPSFLGYSRTMENIAKSHTFKQPIILHQHGIWTRLSRTANIIRSKSNAATIITPHGSLKPWALKKSAWKKRAALMMYENSNLVKTSCIHAVSDAEAQDIRSFGLVNPVAVIPNGISENWMASKGDGVNFRTKFGISTSKRVLLFLSRITPVKGLPMLLESIADLGTDFSEWVLVIAGNDEFNHKKLVFETVVRLGLIDKIIFTGPLFDQSKRDAFAASDLFVLPSYSEAAPIVILEALSAGVPVVATKASPWNDLEEYKCGWLTEIDRESLANGLRIAISSTRSDLSSMGQRGRDLIMRNYTWYRSAKMLIDLYGWVLGFGEKPAFVTTA